MTSWGYARVSTVDQDTAPQFDALRRAGIDEDHIITDHASGTREDRPGLTRLLKELEEGDVLTVWKLDRLGRSLAHLIRLVDELGKRGVEFRSLTDAIDTTTTAGRLTFHIIASVAQFEREVTVERTRAALALAKQSGRPLGRPTAVTPEQYEAIHRLRAEGKSHVVIGRTTGLTRAVVGRVLRGEIASLDKYSQGEQ